MIKQKITLGSIVEISLGPDLYGYGQVISKAELAFYDRIGHQVSTEHVNELCTGGKILFVISVMNSAIKNGRWKIVGRCVISPELQEPRQYFIQDKLSKSLSIYNGKDGSIRPAERKEIEGLECAAVWEPEHVEDRLRDQLFGRPNLWVEQLKPI